MTTPKSLHAAFTLHVIIIAAAMLISYCASQMQTANI
jgi:hypothetical protein